MSRKGWLAIACTALFLGCGGSGAGVSFSCDTGNPAGAHNCYDLTLSGGDINQAKNDCTQNKGGTIGTACTRTGAVSGCMTTAPAYGGSLTAISWDYSGDVTFLMGECAMIHGTWVHP
jgi:hypothetical protein